VSLTTKVVEFILWSIRIDYNYASINTILGIYRIAPKVLLPEEGGKESGIDTLCQK
jgi:hypothetical protein